MITVLAYILTFLAVFLPINSSLIGLIGGIAGRLMGFHMGALFASFIIWNVISFLWLTFEGGYVPITVLLGSIAILFISINDGLTKIAKDIIAAEQWAIIIFGCWLMYNSEVIRWY